MMVLGGSKRAVPLRTADRPEEFKPLEVSPQMRAVLEQCEARRLDWPQQQQEAQHETA